MHGVFRRPKNVQTKTMTTKTFCTQQQCRLGQHESNDMSDL